MKVLPTGNDPSEIEAKVKASLSADKTIDTILSVGSQAGEPAIRASKAVGVKANVATFDLPADFMKAVAAGAAAFGIDQQQYLQGYLPVVFLVNYSKYGLIPGGNVASGPNLITKDKAAQVIDLATKGIR